MFSQIKKAPPWRGRCGMALEERSVVEAALERLDRGRRPVQAAVELGRAAAVPHAPGDERVDGRRSDDAVDGNAQLLLERPDGVGAGGLAVWRDVLPADCAALQAAPVLRVLAADDAVDVGASRLHLQRGRRVAPPQAVDRDNLPRGLDRRGRGAGAGAVARADDVLHDVPAARAAQHAAVAGVELEGLDSARAAQVQLDHADVVAVRIIVNLAVPAKEHDVARARRAPVGHD